MFLGYGRSETRLIDELERKNCDVNSYDRKISLDDIDDSLLYRR